MSLRRKMMATSSSLEFHLPQVPPARSVECDHPAVEVKGVVTVSSSLVPASRHTTATRSGPRYHLHRRS